MLLGQNTIAVPVENGDLL